MRSEPEASGRASIEVPTEAGSIRGHLWIPDKRTGTLGVVIIHPATAVPERMYSAFAAHLAEQGLAAITYDYRGTGTSGNPRHHRSIRMRDWMEVDVPAVARWARERYPEVPHLAIGHSIGGHALSLNYGTAELPAFVTIASHAGVTSAIPDPAERRRVGVVLRVIGPIAARILGYVPGRRLGLGEDMPGAAMLEWSRWSRLPGYFFDDRTMDAENRAGAVTANVLAIGFTDDPWATPPQIDVITSRLKRANVTRRTIDLGADYSIGHMGFFRRTNGEILWPMVSEWLRQQVAAHR